MGIASATQVLISASNVHVRFGNFVAVRDVSFELAGGDLLGLIGPNGAGKTTLLRSLACLQPTTLGTISIFGEIVKGDSADMLQHLGFTPDNPPVYEELSIRDFLRFISRAYDIPGNETEERIDFWLEKVALTDKAEAKIKGLSRGMKQRVGLARTLLPNPSIILLDEPAAALDPVGRYRFRQLLNDLRNQGKAIIVSSHILSDMEEYCTHIGIMSRGKLESFGTIGQFSAHDKQGRTKYRMTLARSVPNAPLALSGIKAISNVEMRDLKITFEADADPEEATKLLAELMQMRFPICEFGPVAIGLEEAYLKIGHHQVD